MGKILETKSGTLCTLKAFPSGSHETMLSFPSVTQFRSISCSFQGNNTLLPPFCDDDDDDDDDVDEAGRSRLETTLLGLRGFCMIEIVYCNRLQK
jgi:hypothetical protein